MIKCYWDEKEIEFKPFKYPAGEVGYKIGAIPTKVICWFEGSDDILLLGMLTRHFPDAHFYIPYLPFSREDRRVSASSSFGLDLFGEIFDSCKHLTTYDVHSCEGFNLCNIDELSPVKDIMQTVRDVKPDVVLFPDEGARERYIDGHNLEIKYPIKIAYGEKVRDVSTGEIIKYEIKDVHSSNRILVIDDICDGGRTFIEAAKLLPNKKLYLHVSHGIFSKGFDELKQYYKHIYTTDSYKGARDDEFVTEYRCI